MNENRWLTIAIYCKYGNNCHIPQLQTQDFHQVPSSKITKIMSILSTRNHQRHQHFLTHSFQNNHSHRPQHSGPLGKRLVNNHAAAGSTSRNDSSCQLAPPSHLKEISSFPMSEYGTQVLLYTTPFPILPDLPHIMFT